ncbi:MAG TPA: glucokinase [Thermoanaerobaculia bacterium]|nr:glucokinase [Thermoanaerobaculia bacterium]
MILAGDVGGTKTNLALYEPAAGGPPRLLRAAQFRSADYPGLGAVLREFLAGERGVGAACFGVPGPVLDNRADAPNLAWVLDGGELAREAGIARVELLNDLVATAYGLPLLGPAELAVLHPAAAQPDGALALIAAGTGLGMALLPPGCPPLASEGGHMDFAPRTDDETAVWRHLRTRFGGHVSVERVVSGPGLRHVYEALRGPAGGGADEAPELTAALADPEGDAAPAIAEAALAGRSPRAARALDLWAEAYGAAAGNLALVGLTTGGVFVGGGMAPKLLPKLADGSFVRGYLDKGRFRPLLASVPVWVVLNEATAVLGAARWACAAPRAAR